MKLDPQPNSLRVGESSSLFTYARGFGAAHVIHHLLAEGVLEALTSNVPWRELGKKNGYRLDLFEAVLEFLTIEGLLERVENGSEVEYRARDCLHSLLKRRGYLSLLVGGYGRVFQELPRILRGEAAVRDGQWVSLASCQIAKLDTIPLTCDLVRQYDPTCKLIVDFGCGNAQYLTTLCRALSSIQAVGIEPDRGAYEAGLETVRLAGLSDRIELVNREALDYHPQTRPSFMLFGFVLQEIVGQSGIARTVEFLRSIRTNFAQTKLLVFEVDHAIGDLGVMRTEMGLGFYNPYFMLHPLTNQKLLRCKEWEGLFAEAGFSVLERRPVDACVDPTGLVVGYVLDERE